MVQKTISIDSITKGQKGFYLKGCQALATLHAFHTTLRTMYKISIVQSQISFDL